jgi:hypothetical protein
MCVIQSFNGQDKTIEVPFEWVTVIDARRFVSRTATLMGLRSTGPRVYKE